MEMENASLKVSGIRGEAVAKQLAGLWFALLLFAVPLALGSFMIFDAPGSEDSMLTKVIFFGASTAPLSLLVAGVQGIRNPLRAHQSKIAYLPFINIVTVLIGVILLEVFCEGKFTCWL